MSEARLIDANAFFNEFPELAIEPYINFPTVELENLIKPVAEIKCDISEEDKQKLLELLRKERPQLVMLEPERPQGEWIPVSERLPEEKLLNLSGSDFGFDFEKVLCTTIWGNVRAYKFGKQIGHDKPHFWLGGVIMDKYVIAWQTLPEPYKKEGEEE